MELINLDADPINADWIQVLHWSRVAHAAEFLDELGVAGAPLEDQRRAVADFMRLPAATGLKKRVLSELRKMGLTD